MKSNQMSNVISKYKHNTTTMVWIVWLVWCRLAHVSSLHSENVIIRFFFRYFLKFSLSTQLLSWERTSIGFLTISHRYTSIPKTANNLWNSVMKQWNISWMWFIQSGSIFVISSQKNNNFYTFYVWMTIDFKNEWYNLHNRKKPKHLKRDYFIQFPFDSSFERKYE